mgnify:CR=1 FL=1
MKHLKPSCLSDMVNMRRTPIAIAVILMHGFALAQPASNTTSADVPEAKTLFETGARALSLRSLIGCHLLSAR